MFAMKSKVMPIRDKRTGRFVSQKAFKNIMHAIATIAKDAKASIKRSDKPANPGQPIHTRKGDAKLAIRFAADPEKKSAVAGMRFSVVGESGRAHEIGGEFKGERYEKRPTMLPALERAVPRMAGQFTGSIGE